jgi:hypothetical protein
MYKPGDLRRKAQRRLKRRLIAVAAIIGIIAVGYFLVYRTGLFFSHEGVPESIVAVETTKDGSEHPPKGRQSQPTISLSEMAETPEAAPLEPVTITPDAAPAPASVDAEEKSVVANDEDKRKIEEKPEEKSTSNQDPAEERSPGSVYKIVSVAHFYNEPDEKTRRKAYVNHWNNSYASIRPTHEKNGFIYVEFTNNQGQTSKGWLRKKDLKEVNAYVDNNKE